MTAIDYPAVLVAQDFVSGGSFGPTAAALQDCEPDSSNGTDATDGICNLKNLYWYEPINATQLGELQQNVSSLKRLENRECMETFGTAYVTNYRIVLLVSNAVNATDSILEFFWSSTHLNLESYRWMCRPKDPDNPPAYCDLKGLMSNAADWQMTNPNGNGYDDVVNIDYCLAEPMTELPCSVGMSRTLLVVVIIFNIIKVACFIVALKFGTYPLITVGDAIRSFLENSDSTTSGFGTFSALDISQQVAWRRNRRHGVNDTNTAPSIPNPNPWNPRLIRWFQAASWRRWGVTIIMSVSVEI